MRVRAIMLGSLFVVPAMSSSTAFADWKTYEYSAGQVTVEMPDAWQKSQADGLDRRSDRTLCEKVQACWQERDGDPFKLITTPSNTIAGPSIPFIPVTRQVSNVTWENWQKASNAYEGRFGKAYSVGTITISPTNPSYFIVFQVRNTAPVTVDAKCEVKAASSGQVVYSLNQRLEPGQASDLDGAGDMHTNEPGERYSAGCDMVIRLS